MLVEIIALIVVLASLKIYLKLRIKHHTIREDLSDRVVLITGASAGIGKATAKTLAKHGASIHMLCRNREKAERVAEQIRTQAGNSRVYVWELDLSRLNSVREFAKKILNGNVPIHLLINNAGSTSSDKRRTTKDGLDETMATNHFGHFLLTKLLLERIKSSAPARIINVASGANHFYNISLENLHFGQGWKNAWQAYCTSKLANVMFTRELAKRLQNTGVTTNSLNPGFVATEISREMPAIWRPIFHLFLLFSKTIEEGAQTTLYLATAPELTHVSGHYFGNCKQEPINPQALDDDVVKRLWELSEKLTLTGSSDHT